MLFLPDKGIIFLILLLSKSKCCIRLIDLNASLSIFCKLFDERLSCLIEGNALNSESLKY